jgi:hypothetical protein
MTLRWSYGTYVFTDLANIPADTTAKLDLNDLIASKGLSADHGSVEINYTGRAGIVTAMNHISADKNYDEWRELSISTELPAYALRG